jgi:hypothetical protein
LRANGAIEGGAEAFVVGDNVYVMKKHDNTVIKVIGLVNGPRKCGGYAVYRIYSTDPSITHSVVVVYHIATKTFLMSPRDSNDADYVAWLATKTTAPDSAEMFEDYFHPDVAPYKINPDTPADETDKYKYYHYDFGGTMLEGMNAYNTYPQSRYGGVFGSSPLVYAGVRTESIRNASVLIYYVICNYNWLEVDSEIVHTVNMAIPFGSEPSEQEAYDTYIANIPTDRPMWSDSPINVVADSIVTDDISFYSLGKMGSTLSLASTLKGSFMPGTSEQTYIPSTNHTIYKMKGKKTENQFAMITLVVAHALKKRWTVHDYFETPGMTYFWQTPTVHVQACAGNYTNINDWDDEGGDLILGMVLEDAVELFYSLNGFEQEESGSEFASFTPYMDCDVTIKK